jgi:cyclase
VTRLAPRYGSQAVVVAIDAKRTAIASRLRAKRQRATAREARRVGARGGDRGAGEILLTSIDRDGTRSGFDCELTAAVSSAVPIPVIASGGAGTFEHFHDVFTAGRPTPRWRRRSSTSPSTRSPS